MQITSLNTDDTILAELGSRLAATRLERNLSQAQLAVEAGVSKSTVERLEDGEPASLASFIRVLRALGLADGLERIVPEPLPSPIEQLKLQGRRRRRASGSRGGHEDTAAEPWTWGDDAEGGR
ncbi:MAG: helix-turn-helix transcriptional regulator [Thermoleophilaceae bacterium]